MQQGREGKHRHGSRAALERRSTHPMRRFTLIRERIRRASESGRTIEIGGVACAIRENGAYAVRATNGRGPWRPFLVRFEALRALRDSVRVGCSRLSAMDPQKTGRRNCGPKGGMRST